MVGFTKDLKLQAFSFGVLNRCGLLMIKYSNNMIILFCNGCCFDHQRLTNSLD